MSDMWHPELVNKKGFHFSFYNDLAFRSKPIRPRWIIEEISKKAKSLFISHLKVVKRTQVLQGPFGPLVGSKTTPKNANRP